MKPAAADRPLRSFKSHRMHPGGYVVAWCMLLLTVTSILIAFEQQRRNALLNRNRTSEHRMHIEHQSAAIRSIISDCARRTADWVNNDKTRITVQTGRRQATDFNFFPHAGHSTSGMVMLKDIACPPDERSDDTYTRLFRAEQLAVPPGFGEWQYRNHRPLNGGLPASGQPAVFIRMSTQNGDSVARSVLIALHEKAVRTSSPTPVRMQLSDLSQPDITLTWILAEQP